MRETSRCAWIRSSDERDALASRSAAADGLAVEHAAHEGVQTIDMLRGNEEYKKLWHTERVATFGFMRKRSARMTTADVAA
jgi:CelD/BcsL family acetyltransferase involved in cellulose biosynthesis